MNDSVLIVEDHELLAQSLVYALRAEGLEAQTFAPTSAEHILKVAEQRRPDVVLLDLELGGDIGSSLDLVRPLTDQGAAVMMVTGVTDRLRLAECLEAGATGLLHKSLPFEELVVAIQEVVALGSLVTPEQRQELLGELRRQRAADAEQRAPFDRLTPREQEVLTALIDGRSAEKIAEESFVSLATVRSQIRAVLLKLDVNSQLAAVALARQVGWTPTPGDVP